MVQRNFIRLLAAVLMVVMLSPCAFADAGERLAVEREVYDFLTEELNLSTAAACGVLANIEHESNFQPTIFGDKGTSYGLCQWHNDRFTALRGYCSAIGLDYRTVEGQMAYLRYELGNKYTTLLLSLQAIENTPDGAYRAAYLWCVQFEKPSNMQVKANQRGELAQGKYWARYNRFEPIIIIDPLPEPTEPSPEVIIEQLRQNPVTIPLPPEEEQTDLGEVRYVKFQKPAFRYYVPWHLPAGEEEAARENSWAIPALAGIFAAMVIVVIFPTKKPARKLYRRDADVVK